MKAKSSILLYLCVVMGLCMTITSTQAQSSTHTGNITVTTQAEVDALRDTLAGKTIIAGDLTIGYTNFISSSNITDLTPLSNIAHIKRNLIIRQNEQLVNLNGLHNLQTITGGDFRLEYNDRLTTVDFSKLETIAGYFDVNHNDRLTTLGNFPVLQTMGRFFRVWENDRLTTLGNFSALRSISEHFSVFENNRLTTLGNFPVLTSIGLGFYNVYVPTLFRKLNRVSLVVEYNPELPDDSVRSKLMRFLPGGSSAVRGYIFINRIKQRTYLGDITVSTQAELNALFTTLISIDTIDGDLTIGSTDTGSTSDITDLTPLGNIVHITGNLIIEQNGELVNQKSLTNLQTIGGHFSVSNNARLTALNFSKLQTIGGYFSISNNGGLTAFDFSKLQTIGGYFQVNDNDGLTAFDFFKLETIEGYFAVQNNDGLTSFGNFTKLQIVEGYVDVNNNDRLTTLGNFSKLETIEGYFSVTNNDTLTTLGSFPALLRIGIGTVSVPIAGQSREGVSILVENNLKLSNCSVLAGFLSGEDFAVSGEIFINANTTGCNSPSTIDVSNISRVYIGDITVRTQAELNSLRAILRNIHTIEGSVTIGYYHHGNPSSDITDLTPFRNIVHITGNLYVFRNHQLVDMSPLTNLQIVGGEFDIVRNTRITTLNFPVLKTTGGRLFRVPADDKTTGGRLFRIVDNSRVTTLNFPVLDSIKGHVQILQSAHLNFPVLQTIEGNLEVVGNNTLNFPVLQTIEGYLAVQHSDTLTTLDFPVLDSIGGFFQVNYNDRLTTLNFPVLQTIGRYFQVNDNHKLMTLGVFPALEIIEESFVVRRNSRLTTLGNFPVLTSIGEHLTTLSVSVRVENNSSLSDCYILTEFLSGRVHAVKGSISIRNNATDGGCNSQSDILSTVYRKDITVSTQAEVNALRTTLTNIDSIDGNLTIGYTDDSSTRSDITDLTPLTNIVHITENLIIQQNGQLVNLNALNNLQTIGESFRVRNNDSLTTLGNFPALTSIGIDTGGESILVERNPSLSTCCVLTDFFSDEVNAVSGDISINGNATGCNAESEINATTLTLTSFNESIAYNDTDSIAIDFIVGCGSTGWTSAITYMPANANFITLSSTGDANQTGAVTLIATPTANTGAARTATITLSTTGGTASQTVVITQAETPHTLTLTSRNMTIAHDATTASDIIFNVGGGATGWISFITYTPPGANFITLAPVMNVAQTGEVTTRTTLTGINTGVERTATITLTTTGIGTPVIQRIVITQQSPPTIMLSTSNQTIAHNFTDPIDISFTVGGSATGWTSAITYTPADANFIMLSSADGTGITSAISAITIMATSMENMGNERSATITFITSEHLGDPVTAEVIITQAGAPGSPMLEITTPSGIRDTVVHRATTALDSVEIVFTVGGGALGWTSMISYGEGVDEFITLSNTANVNQTGEVRIKAAVTENGEVDRSATITLSTTGQRANFSAATSAITITQLAPVVAGPPSLMVSTFEDTTINHETGALAITFTLGGRAKGWTGTVMGDNFITLDRLMNASDSNKAVTIMATYGANMAIYGSNTRVERKDNIILETTDGVADTVVITQKAIPVYTGNVVVDNNGRFADGSGDLPDGSSIDFTNITTIDGNLTIESTARNVNLSSLSGVTKITGNIRMIGNTAITNLSAFSSLDTLGGRLIVRNNTSLTTLGELNNLTTIEERLFISENAKLTTLGSFPALQSIAGFFRVDKNPVLTSLGSFPSLTSIGMSNATSIRVTGNAMLSSCNLLTEFLTGGMYDVSPGMIILGVVPEDSSLNNAVGCRTVTEITDAAAAVPHTITLITPTGNTTIDHDVVVAQTIRFNVGGGATGWTSAITGENFITLNTAMNDAQRGGVTVMATPTANTGTDDRSATITFTTTGGTATAATFAITITQLALVVAAPPTLVLTSPPTVMLSHDVVVAQTIRFTVGGGATGWTSSMSGDDFIALTDDGNETGAVVVTAALSGANTGVERRAVITFTSVGGTGTATAMVTITQSAAPHTITLTSPTGNTTIDHDVVVAQTIRFNVGGGATGWTSAITGDGFITLNTAMNDAQRGGVTVMATPTANTGTDDRSATITFTTTGGTATAATFAITITQLALVVAAPPTLVLTSPPTVMLSHDVVVEQTIRFTVGGGATGWTSSMSGDNFITLTDDGNETGAVVVTAALSGANAGVERSAIITFTTEGGTGDAATATVTITQSAAPPSLDLTSPSTVTLAHNNDATTSSNIMFTVGGGATGWSSSITYTPAGANFITLDSDMNTDQRDVVVVEATPTGANTGVERRAVITFTSMGGTGTATAMVTITQSAAPPSLDLTSPSTVTLAHDVVVEQTIRFTVGGSATGWTSSMNGDNFITLTDDGNETGDVVVTATLSGANTGVERSAMITFTTEGGTGDAATATVTITQSAAPPTLLLTSPFMVTLAHDVVAEQTITFTVGGSATGWASSMSGDNFITLTDDGNETGNVVVTATPSSANMSTAARSAVITFTTDGGTGAAATATVTITQGVAGAPTLLLTSPFMVTLAHDVVTAQTITFTVGDATGWTSEITGDNFITLTDDGAMMGAVVVTATPSGANTGVERSAMIMFTTEGGTGAAATVVVMITQSAAPPTLVLTSPSTVTLSHDVVTEQTIRFTVGGSASGWTSSMSGDNFITLTDDGNETGAVVVTATPSSANTGVKRSAMITFTTEGGTGDAATQTVTITQDAAPALPPALTLSSGNMDTLAHGAGSTSTIEFSVANAIWTATSDQSYVTLDPSRGDAGDSLMVTATAEANTGAERMATITITATGDETTTTLTETVTITQETAPTIRLTSHTNGENIAIAHDNTDLITIGFTLGGSAMGWGSAITYTGTETNFIDLSLTEGTNPTGMITITATPIENMDVERSATITFMTTGHLGDSETAEVMITQAGAPGTPTLEIIPPSGVRDTVAYTATTTLDAVEIVFTVGNATGWASMISYGTGEDGFITLSNTANVNQTGEVRIKATVTENEGVERSATITLSTTGQRADFSAATREITIIQRGAPPTLMLTSHTDGDSIAIIHDDTNPITISFTFGGSEASSMSSISYVPENANFITLEPENNDESTRAITITPSANTSTVPRTATITLITTEHEGTPDSVSLTIAQAAAPKIILRFFPNGFTQPITHNNTNPITISFTLGGSATSSMSSISYVPENANFITLEPENNDESTRAITLTPTANATAEPRTATITLITAEHAGTPDSIFLTIMQGAAPVLELISNDISIAHDATHAIPIFTVGGSATGWRSTITYTPRDVNFITLSPRDGTEITTAITIMATPTVNTRGDRTAAITLRTTGHVGTPVRRTLTITQAAAPTIMLTDHTDGDSIAIAHNNTDPITIDFTLGGSATSSMSTISYMPENANFITLELENNDESTRTITITPSANTSAEPRTATITLRTTGHEGTPDSVSLTIMQGKSDTTTLSTHTKELLFMFYPNPTEGTLTIEGVTRYLQMYIYDLVGREVMTYSLTPSKKTVDVSDLPSGMYVVTLQGEGKTWKEVLMKR